MVFHVGIGQFRNSCVVYNEATKISKHCPCPCLEASNEFEYINAIFKKIKEKVDGEEPGCLCVQSKLKDNNEIRKAFIEGGKQCGFKKVQIVDEKTLLYSDYAILTNQYNPNNGDIIWVLRPWECYIWEKTDSKAKMLTNFQIPPCSKFDSLQKIQKISRVEKIPNLIVYDTLFQRKIDSDIGKTIFPACIGFFVQPPEFPIHGDAALIRARIMANDPEVVKYDTEIQLGFKLKIEINGKELISLDEYELLPYEKRIMVSSQINRKRILVTAFFTKHDLNESSEVVIYEEEINLTQEMMKIKEVAFTFKMDINKICSTNYSIPREKSPFVIKRRLPQISQIEQPPSKKVSKGSQTQVASIIKNTGLQKSIEVIDLVSDSDLDAELEILQINDSPQPKITMRLPNNSWFKEACEKFGLVYSHLIPNIEHTEILSTSKPNECKFASNCQEASFRVLSLLLSGNEDANKIKTGIIGFYFKHYKELDEMQEPEFYALNPKIATDMMPIHWKIVSKILECRIGVYEVDGLKKYGDWSKDDSDTITFLFKKDGENDYGIVLSLI